MTCTCVLMCLACVAATAQQDEFVTDPKSPELLKLATPLVVDESQYDCGPLREPGKTYYVSLEGNDGADGLTWDTAWRHVHHAVKWPSDFRRLFSVGGKCHFRTVRPTITWGVPIAQQGHRKSLGHYTP